VIHGHQDGVQVEDQLRGRAQKAVNKPDQNGIAAEVWQIGVLADEGEVDELRKPAGRARRKKRGWVLGRKRSKRFQS